MTAHPSASFPLKHIGGFDATAWRMELVTMPGNLDGASTAFLDTAAASVTPQGTADVL